MEMKYWLHRISYEWEVSYSLFDQGYLSIGWSTFMNTDVLQCIRKDGEQGFNRFMEQHGESSRSRWNLWHFSQFRKNDIVVVPLFDKEFAICQVLDEAIPISNVSGLKFINQLDKPVVVNEQGIQCESTNKSYDIGFLVRIKKMLCIPRSYADAALTARMKMRQTNGDISDIGKSVETALRTKAPVSIHDSLIDATVENIQGTMQRVISPDMLERTVKWYMKKKGADSVRIPAKNESGKENGADADVIAEFNDLRIIFYIQVKKHEGITNDWAVHQIAEYKQQKQDEMNDYTYISWVISMADFSDVAVTQAKENGVRLIGGSDFVRMLMNCGISDIDEAISS